MRFCETCPTGLELGITEGDETQNKSTFDTSSYVWTPPYIPYVFAIIHTCTIYTAYVN